MRHSDPKPAATLSALTDDIQKRYADMSPQFQIGARYLLDYANEVAVKSMRQIAAQAGVQPATLVRLAQTLGYKGWGELKQVFVGAIHGSTRRYADQARAIMRSDDLPAMMQRTLDIQANNIHLLQSLNAERLDAATAQIAAASHVYIGGFRASHAAAFSFHYLYRLFRRSVSLLRADAGTLEIDLDAITARDVVIIIAFAPYSQEAIRVLQAGRDAQASVIALCDSVVSPLGLEADHVLLFSTDTPSFFPSVTAAQGLTEILVEQLLARSGRRALADLRRREERLHRSGAYLN